MGYTLGIFNGNEVHSIQKKIITILAGDKKVANNKCTHFNILPCKWIHKELTTIWSGKLGGISRKAKCIQFKQTTCMTFKCQFLTSQCISQVSSYSINFPNIPKSLNHNMEVLNLALQEYLLPHYPVDHFTSNENC